MLSSKRLRASIVVDLGFGDSGKGLLTDFLVRRDGAGLVVRFNGGAQAGHNVVTPDGRHHTFAQLGAGSFVGGVRSFLSRHVVVHPTALLREGEALRGKGVPDAFSRLRISERARVITPFHQAAGRLREMARGEVRHGTCGVGVGETVGDALARPEEAVLAGDLGNPVLLRHKAGRIRERKRLEIQALSGSLPSGPASERERVILESEGALDGWIAQATRVATLGLVTPDTTLAAWMAEVEAVVFEGAQGVLLDEWNGFHPYTTWSCCTLDNAMELLAQAAPGAEVERIGVLRAYAMRHGPGPLPTETAEVRSAICEHNRFGEWQGAVRYGWFDAVLARYALEVVGPLEALAVTHLDAPPRLGRWRLAAGYHLPPAAETRELVAESTAAGLTTALAPPPERCLARQQRLTELLAAARPCYRTCEPDEEAVLRETEEVLGRPIDLISRGPRAADVAQRSGA